MNKYKKAFATFLFSILSIFSFAQSPSESAPQPSGLMNVDGKIYVVVAVILLILIGLFIYLFFLDNKITKLEKKIKQ